MKLFSRAAVAGLLLAIPSPALGQSLNGVFDGLNLLYVFGANPAEISLSPGNAEIANDLVQLKVVDVYTAATLPLDAQNLSCWSKNSPCYCYVVKQGTNANYVSQSGKGYSFLCSSVGPNCDGTPASALKVPGATVPTSSALFVGSFATDATAAVTFLPFYRNGEEVLFSRTNTSPTGSPDPGAWAWTQSFDTNNDPQVKSSPSIAFFPSGSSSVGIFDANLATPYHQNLDGSGNSTVDPIFFLDPRQHAVANTGPGLITLNAQGTMLADSPGSPGPSHRTTRLRLNLDSSNQLWVGTRNLQGVNPHWVYTFEAVLRGYLEPVSRLCSR